MRLVIYKSMLYIVVLCVVWM